MNAPAGATLGVLISGRGSNLQALIDAIAEGRLRRAIGVVISNRADAPASIGRAAAGIETLVIDHRGFPTRDAFDRAVATSCEPRRLASSAWPASCAWLARRCSTPSRTRF